MNRHRQHHHTPLRGFPWRVLIYCIILSYLICDLYLLRGPIRRHIDLARAGSSASPEAARNNRWMARVNGSPIVESQLDQAVRVYNFKRGIDATAIGPANRRNNRLAALDELIDDELLRVHAGNAPVTVDPAKIEAAVQRFESQFPDAAAFAGLLEEQRLAPEDLARLIGRHAREGAWVEENIAGGISVSDDEVRTWFEQNREQLKIPEQRRARHIFLSTVEEDTLEREHLIHEIYRRIVQEGAAFAGLAAEFSEDSRSRLDGGDLQDFSRLRMPADFTDVVFALEDGEISPPFRTTLGWHIVEVTSRRPARDCQFDEVQSEIRQLLENTKRDLAVSELIRRLRRNSVIEIFPAAFEAPDSETRDQTSEADTGRQ